jgi:phosphoribosylformylglycinamidine synthase subunit PurQ / glutaminase
MKCGVVLFPGSNCDHDAYHALKHVFGQETEFLWHQEDSLRGAELVVVPGGFSYGDYLRAGALAALSPVMAAIKRHAEAGGLVLGVCNGFQILLEAGLLPGAMLRNQTLRFECRDVFLRVERNDLPFTRAYAPGQVLRLPIAHAEGNFTAPDGLLDELETRSQVVFRYVSPLGELDPAWNINGSRHAIAGLTNHGGNVLGMMPHPERAVEELLGNTDGRTLFESALASLLPLAGVA